MCFREVRFIATAGGKFDALLDKFVAVVRDLAYREMVRGVLTKGCWVKPLCLLLAGAQQRQCPFFEGLFISQLCF